MKKRILFVHHSSVIGGASYCLLTLLKSVDKTMFYPMVLLGEEGPLRKEITNLGIETFIFPKLFVVPYNKSFFHVKCLLRYLKVFSVQNDFGKWLKKNSIDILYLNNMMLWPYLKEAKECGCKNVLHIREHWPLNEHKKQLEWARKFAYQYADKVVAINSYSASMFPDSNPNVIYDIIDMKDRYKYIPMESIFHEDCTHLKIYLFTGGGNPIKGAFEVIQGFSDVIKNPNARLLILGKVGEIQDNKLKGLIKKTLKKMGRKYYTEELLEAIKRDERIHNFESIYELKHILEQTYCMLSYYTIPHANLALAECVAEGVPCIAAETPESLEYSDHGKYAKLFKMGSFNDFKYSLKITDSDYEELKQRINEGKLYARNLFEPEKNICALNNLLHSLA